MRLFITGVLKLEMPAHLGSGDADGLTDLQLLRDTLTGRPLLTGASIAGALRNDLLERELGYGSRENHKGTLQSEKLFGYVSQYEENDVSMESWLMVDDALGELPAENPIEIRDGVQIRYDTRTAEDGNKYDIELLAAGTRFLLHFEVWLEAGSEETQLQWLAAALHNLETGEIRMGMRKRRGFGQCRVTSWQIQPYDMSDPKQVLQWIAHQTPQDFSDIDEDIFEPDIVASLQKISLLKSGLPAKDDREQFTLSATFNLKNSLLIRATVANANAPDVIHLENAQGQKILSGTSVTGAMRARASRIAHTILPESVANELVNQMFGLRFDKKEKDEPSNKKDRQPTGSRVIVDETVINNPLSDWVQSRVKIDRFTGGAYPQALFSEQPVFAGTKKPTQVQINLAYQKVSGQSFSAGVGLLLLVLKDLWTEDLPMGGESRIGRGRLQGQKATLTLGDDVWEFKGVNGRLAFTQGKPEELEHYVAELRTLGGTS
jgi:CRISPR/Cas system CSM-associated protein Csm3 (group 7 of RAMP superfamily)